MRAAIGTRTIETSTAGAGDTRSLTERLLLSGGTIGALVFIVVLLVEGATRPGYDAWHHPISTLSLGKDGWMQIANFLVCGVLLVGFAVGVRLAFRPGPGGVWGPILLGISGLSLVLAGIFSVDPSLGYPPGAAPTSTVHGGIHLLVSNVGVISMLAAYVVLARRFWGDSGWRAWAVFCIAAGMLTVTFAIATSMATSTAADAPFGLFQRLSTVSSWGALSVLALRLATRRLPAR